MNQPPFTHITSNNQGAASVGQWKLLDLFEYKKILANDLDCHQMYRVTLKCDAFGFKAGRTFLYVDINFLEQTIDFWDTPEDADAKVRYSIIPVSES